MSYQLSFKQLRDANQTRLKSSFYDYKDWSPADWLKAVTCELGDITVAGSHDAIEAELADVVMSLDLLAAELNVDLSHAVIAKFNIVSNRVDSDLFLNRDGELLPSPPGYGPPAI